jgi:hypothetical protein
MWSGTPLFPPQASTMAPRVDNLYFFLLAVAVFFSLFVSDGMVHSPLTMSWCRMVMTLSRR